MFLKNVFPEIVSLLFVKVFNANCNLTVSVSQQTSIINISRTDNHSSIIYNHKFTVNVDNLSHWNFIENTTFSQPEKVNVLINLIPVKPNFHQPSEQTFLSSTDGLILPMHLNPQHCSRRVGDISFESRKQRHYNNDSERLLLCSCPDDTVSESFYNFVLEAHKELVFYVNVRLSILD